MNENRENRASSTNSHQISDKNKLIKKVKESQIKNNLGSININSPLMNNKENLLNTNNSKAIKNKISLILKMEPLLRIREILFHLFHR